MKKTSDRYQRGFTLVEIAIVLVIIGFLVGGVLVGRDLIDVADTRRYITQFRGFQAAFNVFQDKYNCVPGDCANANSLIGPNYAAYMAASGSGCSGNGDGDGLIDAWPCEDIQAVGSLATAGYFPPPITVPTGSAYAYGPQEIIGYFYNGDLYSAAPGGRNSFTWGKFGGGCITVGALTPEKLSAIDVKLDDGQPGTGSLRGLDTATSPCGGWVTGSCASSTTTYATSHNATCRALFYF